MGYKMLVRSRQYVACTFPSAICSQALQAEFLMPGQYNLRSTAKTKTAGAQPRINIIHTRHKHTSCNGPCYQRLDYRAYTPKPTRPRTPIARTIGDPGAHS